MSDVSPTGLVVRVPASSANLGAGFDVFGMALDLYADVGIGAAPDDAHPADEHHPSAVAMRAAGGSGECWVRSSIPAGRGLGFSGAARIGGAALGVLAGASPGTAADDVLAAEAEAIVDIAAGLEGHGDNAAASFHGGVIAWIAGAPVPLTVGPRLRAATVVFWIPEATTSTERSRATLPSTVDRTDAVHNLGAVVQMTLAFERDDPSLLPGATDDRLHQAVRLASIDGAQQALSAAIGAGAWCGWLSGSGPSLAFLAPDAALSDVVAALAPSGGHTKALAIAARGAHLVAS